MNKLTTPIKYVQGKENLLYYLIVSTTYKIFLEA